jgi:predicted DNA-binding antitoxin AbrB/MazE fold protein
MAITVEAVYENGVLKPSQPLPLKERETVRVIIEVPTSPLLAAYGIMGWTGSTEDLERLAMDPEFDPQEDA